MNTYDNNDNRNKHNILLNTPYLPFRLFIPINIVHFVSYNKKNREYSLFLFHSDHLMVKNSTIQSVFKNFKGKERYTCFSKLKILSNHFMPHFRKYDTAFISSKNLDHSICIDNDIKLIKLLYQKYGVNSIIDSLFNINPDNSEVSFIKTNFDAINPEEFYRKLHEPINKRNNYKIDLKDVNTDNLLNKLVK